ncbi:hypothetical protein EN802_13545 [bacterium M00.F.Ca.ET.159.01.1.1]|nr:hypothetical protein EN802_13545 [bacterium M00.F.Ca.ET.159.01.1.1]
MPDTVRTRSALQALLADNTSGAITAQDVRDFLASVPVLSSGAGKPGSAPASQFELYFDTTNLIWYVATGTSAATDWKILGPKKWRLVDTTGAFTTSAAYSGSTVANVDVTNLAGFDEVLVYFKSVTASSSGSRQVLASINNGSSFLNTSGDYTFVSSTGAVTSGSVWTIINAVGTTAVSGFLHIRDFSATTPKLVTDGRTDVPSGSIDTANALNALRFNNSAGNLNGGSIYVWVK